MTVLRIKRGGDGSPVSWPPPILPSAAHQPPRGPAGTPPPGKAVVGAETGTANMRKEEACGSTSAVRMASLTSPLARFQSGRSSTHSGSHMLGANSAAVN